MPKSSHIKSFAISAMLVLTVALFAVVLGGCGESKNSTYPAASSYDEPTGAAGAKEAAAAEAEAKAAEAKAKAEQAAAEKKETVEAPAVDGKAIFASSGCAGCHTLAAAGADGSVGPNLDDLKPNAAQVSAKVKNGGGGMPAFADLSPAENAALAKFVADSAGK